MKLIYFLLFVGTLAEVEQKAKEIMFLIEAEAIVLPLIALWLVFLYLNYKEIFLTGKSGYQPVRTEFELKPLVKVSEPEMEP